MPNAPFVLTAAGRRNNGANSEFTTYLNAIGGGSVSDTGASVAGASTNIASWTGGLLRMGNMANICWIAMWWGPHIVRDVWYADSNALIKRITYESMGLRETVARKLWSYPATVGSTSPTTWQDRNGVWWVSSKGSPMSGDAVGLRTYPERTNLVFKNYSPTATSGWSATGGTFSAQNDAAALLAANLRSIGPNVFSLVNATGVTHYVYGGTNATNNAHCLSVFARYVAGAGARLGWRDSSSTVFTPLVAISAGYARTVIEGVTPPDVDCKFCIEVPNGCTLRFTLQQLELGSVVTAPIINLNTGGTTHRDLSLANTSYIPSDVSGSFLTKVTPIHWSGVEPGLDVTVLTRSVAPADILHAESVAAGWATGDGTTQIQTVAPYVPVDGVSVDVWVAWRAALQYIQEGVLGAASLVTAAYDGAKGGAGFLEVASTGAEVAIQYIEVRQV